MPGKGSTLARSKRLDSCDADREIAAFGTGSDVRFWRS